MSWVMDRSLFVPPCHANRFALHYANGEMVLALEEPMGQEPVERPFRVHERRAVRFVVGMSHPSGGWHGEARVHDIGLGGAGLEMAGGSIKEGDRVILSFIAPTLWDPLEIPARVAWIRTTSGFEPPRDLRRPSAAETTTRFGVAFEATDAGRVLALFELVSTFVFDR